MTNPIRVLLADDSFVVRSVLQRVLDSESDIKVIGAAKDGGMAVKLAEELDPDILILDIEMPVMTGLEALSAIRARDKTLPVIMFSTLTEHGASATIEALTRGASDYATKPSTSSALTSAEDQIKTELLAKIRAHYKGYRSRARFGTAGNRSAAEPASKPVPESRSGAVPATKAPSPAPPTPVRLSGTPTRRPLLRPRLATARVMVVGVSTGGPNALMEFLPNLPATFPVPILMVQHMPESFTRLLAERLDVKSRLEVHEAKDGEPIRPGGVWLAPGGYHMTLEGEPEDMRVELNQDPPENSCRPAVDPLFRSAVRMFGDKVLGVVLTGMGQDGLLGARDIHDAGGQVVVQNEETSVIWGMPGAIAEDGCADAVLPLREIADDVLCRVAGSAVRKAG